MAIIVEDGVRDLMPEVAIEFLREIISSDQTIQVIRLIPVKLSLDYVQDIVYESQDGTTRRRVFGFVPVSAMLNVSHDDGVTAMRLAAKEVMS